MTPSEIKSLQTTGIDWFGNPLKADGLWGPKTAWWAGIASLSPLRQEVIRIALGYHAIGAGEDKTNSIANDGTFVDMILRPAGLRFQPWCVSFCSHVYVKAGVPWKKYQTSAWGLIDWASKQDKLVDEPLPGDLFAFLHDRHPGDTQFTGHGGIVLAKDGDMLYNCEGNVSDSVRAGRRGVTSAMKFIRVMDEQHGTLTFPEKTMRIDGLADR